MGAILCIETSTKNCSVALGIDGQLTASREDVSKNRNHAEDLHQYIIDVLREGGVDFDGLDAIAVSEGPGSYTGLRIGVSVAKGLAYAKKVPLIAVSTLRAMASVYFETGEKTLLIPMIDARRMEVFCAGFDGAGGDVFPTRAEILSEEGFPEAARFDRVIYFGDGAEKCVPLLGERPKFEFLADRDASALPMVPLAEEFFKAGKFVDVAYFTPFYLKDFVAGKKKAE